MSQSRRMSGLESLANVAIGMAASLGLQATVFPLFGFRPSFGENLAILTIFTAVSVARSYAVRRLFNRLAARGAGA